MKKIMSILIILIAAFAVYGSFSLSMNDWVTGNVCPKILGIPACYIVFVCFATALISQVVSVSKSTLIFFIAVGIVTAIATTGTVGELTGTAKCPRTAGGTPMCFISLAICVSLLVSKVILLKISKSS